MYHDNYYRRQDGIPFEKRAKADIVINSGKNDVAFDLFVSKISQLLA